MFDASGALAILQVIALVAFMMCFVVMAVFVVLAAMAAPLSLAAKAMMKKPSSAGLAKDAAVWVFTWLALYGFYVYLTGGAA